VTDTPLWILVHHRAPEGSPEAVEQAYESAREALAGTPGYLGDELLRSPADPGRYLLLMKWRSAADFAGWERGHRRSGHPSALRAFQDRGRPGGHYEALVPVASRPRAGHESPR
jgi:heme-degrading monooxygenase HmoA